MINAAIVTVMVAVLAEPKALSSITSVTVILIDAVVDSLSSS
jgi:hypothetical protein